MAALDGASGSRHGSIPKASVLAGDGKTQRPFAFSTGATVLGLFRERAFSLGAASHTRDTLPRTGYCTAWRKPSHRTLNFNFITGNEGHAAPHTCAEVRSGKIIMPCKAARMKDPAMNKTNKPDLLLRLMLLFNNVTLVAGCILGSAGPFGRS